MQIKMEQCYLSVILRTCSLSMFYRLAYMPGLRNLVRN